MKASRGLHSVVCLLNLVIVVMVDYFPPPPSSSSSSPPFSLSSNELLVIIIFLLLLLPFFIIICRISSRDEAPSSNDAFHFTRSITLAALGIEPKEREIATTNNNMEGGIENRERAIYIHDRIPDPHFFSIGAFPIWKAAVPC